MSILVDKKNNFATIKVNSEKLDSLIAPLLKSELVILNSEGFKNIIIDLSPARYCDSSGLSAILVGNRLCKNSEGTFVLTGLNEPVQKVITISKLDGILNIKQSQEEAAKMF